MTDCLIVFRGAVECRGDTSGPLGLTLVGHATGEGEATVHLAFECAAPTDLPAVLHAPMIHGIAPGQYRITAGDRQWVVAARRAHLHRDVSLAFYRAVPPRPVPALKRLLWRIALAVAASAAGHYWLARRRRALKSTGASE